MANLNPEQQQLKRSFDALLPPCTFDASWSRLLHHSPRLFSASLRLHSIPVQKSHLSPKNQSLISLAVSAASTHLHVPHIHRHTRAALYHGATPAEIVEVLALTSTLGIHACNIGVPLLREVMREEGLERSDEQKETETDGHGNGGTDVRASMDIKPENNGMQGMSTEQIRLKEEFEKKRGYWHGFWEDFLRMSPEFFGAYLEFSGVPWEEQISESENGQGEGSNENGENAERGCSSRKGVLEPKIKELIYCAFDASATHLYTPGLKLHMKNVLKYNGTPEEIMEVLELASLMSMSTLDVGLEVLEQELQAKKDSIGESGAPCLPYEEDCFTPRFD